MSGRSFAVAIALLLVAQFGMAQASSKTDVETRVDSILGKMTIEEKIEMVGGINDFYTRPIPRLAIPSLRMSDGPMGVHDFGLTTAYPAGIALAASWDVDLAERFGAAMGKDARARGVHFILGPGMNIYRAPMNGRNFEYFGEDPFLASRMAVSVIRGIQGQRVIATAKHFAANNSEFARMTLSSDMDERTLREIYLPAFEASVKEARVGAVMDAYNLVNGTYMTQNNHLNNEILKKEWGFDGILMSDWGATHDGVAAANGGLDLEMPSPTFMNRDALLPVLNQGTMPVAILDDKVRRILRKAIEFGFFDQPQTDTGIPSYSQEGRQAALEVARGSMVLLKNAGHLLPLDETKLKTIAVIGPDAYPAVTSGGGSAEAKPFSAVSYLEGISNRLGTKAKVLYAVDVPPLDEVFESSEFVTAPNGESGLKGEYFSNEELKGAPALVRTDKHIHFDWGEGSFTPGEPVDHFAIRWTGYFVPKESADYKFYTSADDGVRLYIGDEIAIDDWQPHSQTMDTAARHLEAGQAYKIRLEYFESVGSAIVGFSVTRADAFVGRETKALAAKADAVIICVGFDDKTESEGSDRTFQLPGGQDELIRQISAVNKNVIVVLTAGGNVDMTRWIENVPAILHAWYPGQEGGVALAQILFGDYSPSGKLPASFERRWEDNPTFHSYYPENGGNRVQYSEGVFLGYRHFDRSATKPLFAFGYGLSYTTFAYSKLSVTPPAGNLNEPVSVSFDVRNTGQRAAAEVAELYVGDSHASVPRPVKELKAFAKVNLKPGETRRVTLTLERRAFSFYDVQKKDWSAEPGDFTILVGGASDNIQLRGKFTLRTSVESSASSATAPSSSRAAIELDDTPTFTVAGITDSTGAGGHGSETRLRTGEVLARETLNLESGASKEVPTAAPKAGAIGHETNATENALRAALLQSPRSFEANHSLGEFYFHVERYREAIPLLEAAYQANPGDHPNALDLTLAFKACGEFAPARKQVDQMLANEKKKQLGKQDEADLRRLLGDLDEKLEDPLAAVREYERAAALDSSEQNYFAWGAELLLHRAAAPAIEVFGKGVRLHPDSARMLAGLGAALYTSGSAEEAAQRLCAASDLEPANLAPYLFLGKMQESASAPLPCAEPKLARFARDQPANALANYYYALALLKRSRGAQDPDTLQHAKALLEKSSAIDPKLDLAYLQLGNLYASRGALPEALAAYQKAVAANPVGSEAHYRLGLTYKRVGEEANAQREFEDYKRLDKTEAATIDRQRRELRQFLFVLENQMQKDQPAPSPAK